MYKLLKLPKLIDYLRIDRVMAKYINAYLGEHKYALNISLEHIFSRKIASFLVVTAIAITLCIPTALFVGVKNIKSITPMTSNNNQITIILKKQVALAEGVRLQQSLQKEKNITNTQFVAKDDALAEFATLSGFENIGNLLPENPLGHIIQVSFTADTTIKEIEYFKSTHIQNASVKDILYEGLWQEKFHAILSIINNLSISLILLIGLGITFMIATVIRLWLESYREEVEILYLLGATKSYIRRPFLYRGLVLSVAGTILALALISALFYGIQSHILSIAHLFDGVVTLQLLSLSDILFILLWGAFLGILGAYLAFAHSEKTW